MKFKLNEGYSEVEELLVDQFYNLTEDEFLSYYDGKLDSGEGAMWILPNGNTISIDYHAHLVEYVFNKFCTSMMKQYPKYGYSGNEFELDDPGDINDKLVEEFGWAKLNTGTDYEERFYIVIPYKMTSVQYRRIEHVLEQACDNPEEFDRDEFPPFLVLTMNPSVSAEYSFSQYSPYEIIKKLKRFTSSGILEEKLLLEKKWVEVTSSATGAKPFYFYATDNNAASDVNTLLPIIDGTQEGTYKQQLNQEILDRLKSEYNSCRTSGTPFSLTITNHSVNPKKVVRKKMLTLADRDLRREATSTVNLHPPARGNFLIHHKVVGEKDNNYKNIVLIDKSHGTNIAHGVHKILEGASFPLTTGRVASVAIQEFDTASKTWAVSNYVDIIIR